jgi:hypothetical protein
VDPRRPELLRSEVIRDMWRRVVWRSAVSSGATSKFRSDIFCRPNPFGGPSVKQLIAYLLDHAILDFSGDLTLDMVRDFLRDDDSPESRAVLGKLVEDRGVDDMVVTLADCLQDYLKTGLNEEVVREQIRLYSES